MSGHPVGCGRRWPTIWYNPSNHGESYEEPNVNSMIYASDRCGADLNKGKNYFCALYCRECAIKVGLMW